MKRTLSVTDLIEVIESLTPDEARTVWTALKKKCARQKEQSGKSEGEAFFQRIKYKIEQEVGPISQKEARIFYVKKLESIAQQLTIKVWMEMEDLDEGYTVYFCCLWHYDADKFCIVPPNHGYGQRRVKKVARAWENRLKSVFYSKALFPFWNKIFTKM